MFGSTILMEFKTGWKGFFIFTLLIILISAGMPAAYPMFKESLITDYEGSENIILELPEDDSDNAIDLSWEPVDGAMMYIVRESNQSHMTELTRVIYTADTNLAIPYNFTETRYYVVLALINTTDINFSALFDINITSLSDFLVLMDYFETAFDTVFIGMTATDVGASNPFEEMLNNPAYSGFTGGRDLNFLEIKGFLTVELFSLWWMMVGFFIAYMAVAIVANDFSEKRMDLIFSTPLSRSRYLLEKFIALSCFSLCVLIIAAGALIAGVDSIGYSDELEPGISFLSMFGCLPFLMVITSVGILTAVIFRSTRVGMGLTFMFLLFEFIFYTIAGFSKDLEWFRYISIMEYWDYRAILLDSDFNIGYFVGLFVAAFVILGLAIYVFKKRDIPA